MKCLKSSIYAFINYCKICFHPNYVKYLIKELKYFYYNQDILLKQSFYMKTLSLPLNY